MKNNHLLALTAAAVLLSPGFVSGQDYQSTVLADHPVSYGPLQETNGPLIHDIVGGNNGTLQVATDAPNFANSDVHSAFANETGTDVQMRGPGILFGDPNDAAIYFTNVNTPVQITAPYAASLDGTNFSVEFWANLPTFPLTVVPGTVDMIPVGFEYNGGQGQAGWLFDLLDGKSGTAQGRVDCWAARPNVIKGSSVY